MARIIQISLGVIKELFTIAPFNWGRMIAVLQKPWLSLLSFLLSFSFFHSVLHWSVAVSTVCRHSSRVVAFFQAVARPKFRGPRSASIARSQVWLGLPAGYFQSGGTCRIAIARALWWSSQDELGAIWPKSRRRLWVTSVVLGGWKCYACNWIPEVGFPTSSCS